MPKVRIYQPRRTATQQGVAKTHHWLVEHVGARPRSRDPLMGWTSSADTSTQLRLRFSTREEAISYATRNGLDYELVEPRRRRPRIKSYADNFRYEQVQ